MANNITDGFISQRICIDLPPKINSAGLAKQFEDNNDGYEWLDYTTPRILLLVATMLIMAQAFHVVLKRIGLPIFISQILAGLVLSKPVLQKIKLADDVITQDNAQLLGVMGNFGYAFFIFQSGVKMDLGMVTRVGRKAWYIAILIVTIPWFSAISITLAVRDRKRGTLSNSLYLAPLYCMTSFPVINCLLADLKILNSELGRLAQSSAIIADILSFLTLVIVTFLRKARRDLVTALAELGAIICYVLVVLFVLRPAMLFIVRLTKEGKEVSQAGIYVVVIIFLLFLRLIPEWSTEFKVVGLYIFGLTVPHGPPLGSALVNKFDCLVSRFLLPIFVTTSAMRVQRFDFHFGSSFIFQNAMIALVTILIKFGTCFFPSLYWNMHKNDAVALSLIMNGKGIVELAAYTSGSNGRFVNSDTFNFMLTVLLVLASIVPVLVKKLYDPSRKYAGYQIRKLIDCKPDAELQILACIHLPNNVSSVINVLSIACPKRESPIAVSVIHLIKLVGQSSPIFVSHQKKRTNAAAYSYSENVILSFKKFEGANWGNVSINTFTAISPPEAMHDDICTLALDKLASLIILPFHRTWYIDGSLESEDLTIRSLNRRILEKAPCSVGILVDHGNLWRPINHLGSSSDSLCNVGMLYLGGNDDREALTFAKRMAKDNRIKLTVAHFIASSDDGEVDWQTILDSEVLRDIKNSTYIRYEKYIVDDGSGTVQIVRSMVNEYNLIIVGRRYKEECPQTSCLKEWSEFPELGILGDLLAPRDFGGKCSVLVMQQQQKV